MILNRVLSLVAVLFLFGCSDKQIKSKTEDSVQLASSRFDKLELKVGMNRQKVEDQVNTLLDKKTIYSPYGNNLKGGTVRYRDENWVLVVEYKAGAPAPTFVNNDGNRQGYPPIDEKVIAYLIERIATGSDEEIK